MTDATTWASPVSPAPHDAFTQTFEPRSSPGLGNLSRAAGINALGSMGAGFVTGIANIGSSLIDAHAKSSIAADNRAFQQRQIDRSYDVANKMGLMSPMQISGSSDFGTMHSGTFTVAKRSFPGSSFR